MRRELLKELRGKGFSFLTLKPYFGEGVTEKLCNGVLVIPIKVIEELEKKGWNRHIDQKHKR